MMNKLDFNVLMFILDEFLYTKMLDDDLKMDDILDYNCDISKKILFINNSRYTGLEYIFNMPITEKTETFRLKILLYDGNYDIYNSSEQELLYGQFNIDNDVFLNEIKNNIEHCYYLKEFIDKFTIWKENTKTNSYDDLYNLLLGYYKRKDIEYINNKYVLVKLLNHN